MENDLGLVFLEYPLQAFSVSNVRPEVRLDFPPDAREHIVIFIGIGIQRHAHHLGTHLVEPDREPGTLEARVPRDEHSLALIEICCHSRRDCRYHTFHGALPSFHMAFNSLLSRSVSMGFQKPVCL